jgi:hypothetical protein
VLGAAVNGYAASAFEARLWSVRSGARPVELADRRATVTLRLMGVAAVSSHAVPLSAFLAFVAIACAVTSCGGASDDIAVRSPSTSTGVRIVTAPSARGEPAAAGLEGPTVDLRFFGDALRGRVGREPVNLQTRGSTVTGLFGESPVNLRIRKDGDVLFVSGMLNGVPSDLRVGPRELQGTIGRCAYELSRSEGAYTGVRRCERGEIEPVAADAYAILERFPPTEAAALLGLMLGS